MANKDFGVTMAQPLLPPDTGSAGGDLTEQAFRVSTHYAGEHGDIFAQLLAVCADGPAGAAYPRLRRQGRSHPEYLLTQPTTAGRMTCRKPS